MGRKTLSTTMLIFLLTSLLAFTFSIQPVRASNTVYIRPDGSVDPSTAPIRRDGDIYTFTDSIYDSIVVERDNIVVNGAGYKLQGTSIAGIILEGRSNVTISDMEIEAFEYGISLYKSSNNSVYGNKITNTGYIGIGLDGFSLNNNIFNNTLRNNRIYGINTLWHSDYNNISGNNITYNDIGIWHQSSSHNIISGNNMANNFIDIDFTSSSNIISDNTMTNTTYAGIRLSVSKHNTISGNNIMNCGFAGLLFYSSRYNSISENTIIDSEVGIDLVYWNTNNTIYGNNIVNNNRGVRLSSSSNDNNTFFHNNFLGNVQQVVNVDSTNLWDNGYPSGGNYWSDYTGIDGNGDGIGDKPYVIDGNNQDNYPLMTPCTPTPQVVTATVDIDPDALNLKSEGQWITAYIQLPEGYNPENIDATTVLINETIQPILDPMYDFVTNSSEYIVDHDGDGILERMAKFNRTEVASWISDDLGIQYGDVTLTITGELLDGTPFEGTDIVRVLFPGDADDDGDVDYDDLIIFSGSYGMTIENAGYNPLADFNEDGPINYEDFIILSGNYGKTAV